MTRYMRRSISQARWVPTIGNKAAPTTAEITAGTNLTPDIAEINGFEFSNSPISTPDMATSFTSQIGGEDTAGDSSITFYEDDTTNTIKTALAKGTNGFVVFYPYGVPASAAKCEVWPATITSNGREWSVGNDPARYMVSFAITAVPSLNSVQAA